jgi:hypothetical protein
MSLLLAAAGVPVATHDAGYADLAYAKPATEGACEARFDKGAIEITQAFNTAARTSINVAVITGQSRQTLSAGTRLWVKSSYGPAWRALVLESSGEQIRIAAHYRFVGDLLTDDGPTIRLLRRLDASGPGNEIWVTTASDSSGFRGKLAQALDCAEGIGI